MKSPVIKVIGMITWVVTALCSLHVGLMAMGHDLVTRFGLANNPQVHLWAQYVCGIAGAVSLVLFVMALTCKNCGCGMGGGCEPKGSCNGATGSGYCSRCGSSPCKCR